MNSNPKIFLPLSHNGSGMGPMDFIPCFLSAFEGCNVDVRVMGDSHANRACNRMAADFIYSDCDEMIVIDIDIHFTANHIRQLLSHDAALVYGVYPKKQEDTPPCTCGFEDGVRRHSGFLVEARRTGRGFMRVRREVLEAMKEENGGPALRFHNHGRVEWDFFPSGPVTGELSALGDGVDENGFPLREWLSEDWYFCERARKLGFPTLIDSRIALGHIGTKLYQFPADHFEKKTANTWRDIQGWFDSCDEAGMRQMAALFPKEGKYAEIGVWKGRSLGAFDEFARALGKSPLMYAVDTFQGSKSEPCMTIHAHHLAEDGEDLRTQFVHNMEAIGLKPHINPVIVGMDSATAGGRGYFADESFDMVYIDADHSAEAVMADIVAWETKVKPGGWLCGHDYEQEGVARAVNATLPGHRVVGRIWLYQKPAKE